MAVNTIALAKNYTTLLDEVYRNASVTSDLTSGSELVRAGANANEIIYPQISVTGLGDYDRNSGYTDASVNLEWKSATFNYDRGARITVDVMDDEESKVGAFLLAGRELMNGKVAPEADAFTFATIAGTSGVKKVKESYTTAEQYLEALLEAKNWMDENEVPESDRLLYATATLINSVIALDSYKSKEVLGYFNVKKAVPQNRFYTAIDLLDGKSVGEEVGHYKKATDADDINFMIIHKPALIKFDKHVASNIIPAAQNVQADADIIKYRKYGIVDVYKNKVNGIYVSHK